LGQVDTTTGRELARPLWKGETMELRLKITKSGLRAYRYSRPQCRWFPVAMKDAKAALAAGEAYLVEYPLPWAAQKTQEEAGR